MYVLGFITGSVCHFVSTSQTEGPLSSGEAAVLSMLLDVDFVLFIYLLYMQ